jgi:hypothetical protein
MTLFNIIKGIPAANVATYMAALEKAPILVKSVTSGCVYLLGDLCSQLISGKKVKDLNRKRVLASGIAGLAFHGPLSHAWYWWLDHTILHVLGWTAWWNIIPMLALDSVILCPTWNAIYVGFMGLFLHKKKRDAWKDVK